MEETRRRFGVAVLIDCHSMPSALAVPDMVLGDRYGAACAPVLSNRAEAAFTRARFSVSRNTPYAGGHTTVQYGRAASGFHALQIEINRALYLDEDKIVKKPSFQNVKARLEQGLEFLTAMPLSHLGGGEMPLAAE
jgi:N-formylglutamate amidohydrolase